MGMHTVVAIRHENFPMIVQDKEFGKRLYYSSALPGRDPKSFEFLGDVHSHDSPAVLHYDGHIWCPDVKQKRQTSDVYNDQPPRTFTIITVSGDFAFRVRDRNDIGKRLVSAITSFKRDPEGHPVYVEPCEQAIQIVETFTSSDIGVSVIEGNCSWLVGREETPSWARASKKNHERVREVEELTLALKQGVKVNLTRKKIQDLLVACF